MDRDPLTGLPDRYAFFKHLEGQIRCCSLFGELMSVIVINLRRFRAINREYGYHIGDTMLIETANRIRDSLRQSDSVARIGADEFALLLPGLSNPGQAQLTAHKISQALQQPFNIHGLQLRMQSYAGMALFPQHATNSEHLMQAVDRALIEARETATSCKLFGEHFNAAKPSLLALENELHEAIERNELRLYLQPQLVLESSRIQGFESLARWHHPERGDIPPEQFIGLAEQTGLIEPLTEWSLKSALQHLRMLRHLQPQLTVSVNLSSHSLHHPDIITLVEAALATWQTPAANLILEITEAALLQQPELSLEVLGRLHQLGVGISIDDFGIGYSCLSHLKQLPIDELKIDRSFVATLGNEPSNEKIIRSIIALAHNLDLRVVAEGVQDQNTLERLGDLGCDLAQGRHIAPALRADDAVAWLTHPEQHREIAASVPGE